MAKGARNRAIRKYADMLVKTHHPNVSSKTVARRIRRRGWKRGDVE